MIFALPRNPIGLVFQSSEALEEKATGPGPLCHSGQPESGLRFLQFRSLSGVNLLDVDYFFPAVVAETTRL